MSVQRWNMRAVISTVDIEKSASGMYVKYEDYAEEISTLKAQRDELLAAAKLMFAMHEQACKDVDGCPYECHGDNCEDCLPARAEKAMMAAIANAEKDKI